MREGFVSAIRSHQQAFGLALADDVVERLADYYEFVEEHNPILHLVGPCSPEEFATRHVLESLTMLEFLPPAARFADIGAGAGLPSIPCLLARGDLSVVLIESKEKKAGFLQKVIAKCKLGDRAEIINLQFSEVKPPNVSYVACRALDKFTAKLPQLLKWSGKRKLLLFGGISLSEALKNAKRDYKSHLLPLSERRYLFSVEPNATS